MHIFIKFIPWIIIAYGLWGAYELTEIKLEKAESLNQEVSGLQSKLTKLKKSKQEIETYYSDIKAAKKNIEKISKEFRLVQRKLPEKQNDKENFSFFKEVAKKVLVKEINFSAGREIRKKGYIEKFYTVNAKGTYMQFLLFFELLYKYERLFDVKNILFRTKDVQAKGRFQVIEAEFDIATYIYSGTKLK